MKRNIYRGDLKCKEDIIHTGHESDDAIEGLTESMWQAMNVIYARLEQESYSGRLWVVYSIGEQLHEVLSEHCSCDGFSWEPEETTVDAILWRSAVEDDWLKDFVSSVVDKK